MIDFLQYKGKDEILNKLPADIEDFLDIDEGKAKKQIKKILDRFIDDIIAIVEFPYIEKYYRDTYYHFFSKKHKFHERDSVRISFFRKDIDLSDFIKRDKIDNIQNSFLGFITIRPTSFRIIGHSFISPQILKENSFVCCLCKKKVLVSGVELFVYGFPFCSQDNESITCAESVLINLLDYFSNKFPDYQSVLPSKINDILKNQSFERQLPSTGLKEMYIAYVLKELGFGTKVYSKSVYKEKFKSLLYIYIESGIPIILNLENADKKQYHAVLAIGRESITKNEIGRLIDNEETVSHFSDFFGKILLMNDNCTPYELVEFDNPVDGYKINSFIVPLYTKVHSEAYMFMNYFDKLIKELSKNKNTNKVVLLENDIDKKNIVRFFLTTSRSYKNYISKSDNITDKFRTLLIEKSMPKFIWVAEIIKGDKLNLNQTVDRIVILDATESGDSGSLIVAFNSEKIILRDVNITQFEEDGEEKEKEYDYASENKYSVGRINSGTFCTFANNLKGEHTRWQS